MKIITTKNQKQTVEKVVFEHPKATDGYNVNQLIKHCKPLDENSVYCNLLQCHHFSRTSIIAKVNDKICGFVSGYIIPQQPDTLFLWQIAISKEYRGYGLGLQMIEKILEGEACANVKHIQASITKSNKASWRLFEKLAKLLSTEHISNSFFNELEHFHGEHETEDLITIGPL